MPEDAHQGLFEDIDVGAAGSGVLHAGPSTLADLTQGEQVETPPSRPGDDGLDPFRHSAATIAPLLYPRPRRRIETKAGRSAMTATTCTGSNA
jgi:hypothetical protein